MLFSGLQWSSNFGVSALLPEDEVDEMLYGFRQLNPSVLLSLPPSLGSVSDIAPDSATVDSTSSTDLKQAKVRFDIRIFQLSFQLFCGCTSVAPQIVLIHMQTFLAFTFTDKH